MEGLVWDIVKSPPGDEENFRRYVVGGGPARASQRVCVDSIAVLPVKLLEPRLLVHSYLVSDTGRLITSGVG